MANFRGGFGGYGGGASINQIIQQAQRMKVDIENKKQEINATEFKATAGGGMVEVLMMGNRVMKSIKFKPEIVDADDVEMLEDLVMAAVNDVLAQISKKEVEDMPEMSGFGL